MLSSFRMLFLLLFVVAFSFFSKGQAYWSDCCLKIRFFHTNNCLELDRKILKEALCNLGHHVEEIDCNEKRKNRHHRHADINIFFESVHEEWFSCGDYNWFIPNPECFHQHISCLSGVDLILCRTREAERIFRSHGRTFFLGFTSIDCCDEFVSKDFFSFFHFANRIGRETDCLADVWRKNACLPRVIVIGEDCDSPFNHKNFKWISKRLSEYKLRAIQNGCGIHICPYETGGFAHFLMQGMSTGAVVITIGGPPMDEFIDDRRCLVPFYSYKPLCFANRFFISPRQLEKTIYSLLNLPAFELELIGERNRAFFLEKTREFHENLRRLMQMACDNCFIFD